MAVYGVALYNVDKYGGTGTETYGTGTYGSGTYANLTPGAVSPPTPPPFEPPLPPPTINIFQPDIIWRFALANSSTMINIGEIFSKSVSVALVLNRQGSLSFQLPLDGPGVEAIEPITTCVKAYRKGELVWSGPVWTLEESPPPDNTLSVTCTGWFEILNHRLLRADKNYSNNQWTAGSIAFDLINIANAQRDGPLTQSFPDGSGTVRPTGIVTGTNTDTQVRNRSYQKWQNIGAAIQEWSDVENGYDYEINPANRVFNIYASSLGSTLRRTRPEVQFGYNWGPNNLRSFKRNTDSSTLVTQAHVIGSLFQMATASAGGTPSPLNTYGLWEEQHNLSDVGDPNVLQAFASGEVAIRSTPKVVFSVNPFPWTPNSKRVPEPFVEYRLGDIIYFTAIYGKRIKIERQAIRVYGITIVVDENNNENITDLQVSPNV